VPYLDIIVLQGARPTEVELLEMAPIGADPELQHLEVRVTVAREVVQEVAVRTEVRAHEAVNPIEVHHPERAVIAPQEVEVQAQGAVEATALEAVPEALGEAIEAPEGLQDHLVVDLPVVEVVEVEEIKPI
jgi:hypothetical protein